MLQLGARFYWPEIGRFVQQDPAKDGINWYAYAANNPVRNIDPEGKWLLPIAIPDIPQPTPKTPKEKCWEQYEKAEKGCKSRRRWTKVGAFAIAMREYICNSSSATGSGGSVHPAMQDPMAGQATLDRFDQADDLSDECVEKAKKKLKKCLDDCRSGRGGGGVGAGVH